MSQYLPPPLPGPPGYGPPPGYGHEPDRGTLILVLGILSLVLCQVLGPIVWAMGAADMRKIDAGVMNPRGRGPTYGGMICGIVATVLLGVGLLTMCGMLALYLLAIVGVIAAGVAA